MMKHSALIAPFLACGALPSGAGELPNNMKPSNDGERYLASIQEKNSIAFYTEYIPRWGDVGTPPPRENPLETRSDVLLETCRANAARNDFSERTFEVEALRKLERFGEAGLDADDRKWIASHDNRKAACAALFKANGGGSYLDQIKAWLREMLSE